MQALSTLCRTALLAATLVSMSTALWAQSAAPAALKRDAVAKLDEQGYAFEPGKAPRQKPNIDMAAAATARLGQACVPRNGDFNQECPPTRPTRPRALLATLTMCELDLFSLGSNPGQCGPSPILVSGLSPGGGPPNPRPPGAPEAQLAAERALVHGIAVLIREYGLPVSLEPTKTGGPPPEWLIKAAESTREKR